MKKYLLSILLVSALSASAQKVDSIFVNLYTDSLKKGTYNYINVDGLMSDGSYRPLDSTTIKFTSDLGMFTGNTLYIDRDFAQEKVHIKLYLKSNKTMCREFDMYIKKKEDTDVLPTNEEILKSMQKKKKKD